MPGNDDERHHDLDEVVGDSALTLSTKLGPLARQFTTLTYSVLEAETVGEVLEQITDTAARIIPGVAMVSVTLRSADGHLHTPVHTDPAAASLDEVQYSLGEGPCLDAADPAGPALATCNNLASTTTWPRFGPAAAERGFHALLAVALLPDVKPPRLTGALNLYARRSHTFTPDDQVVMTLLAGHASLALAHTEAVTKERLAAENLRRAIDSRDVIGQAKGILMSRRGLTADEAFDLLRRTSQAMNVKLVQLAETLTTRRVDLDLVDPELPPLR